MPAPAPPRTITPMMTRATTDAAAIHMLRDRNHLRDSTRHSLRPVARPAASVAAPRSAKAAEARNRHADGLFCYSFCCRGIPAGERECPKILHDPAAE